MPIHKEYQKVFEMKLEGIIIKTGMSVNQFYEALKLVS